MLPSKEERVARMRAAEQESRARYAHQFALGVTEVEVSGATRIGSFAEDEPKANQMPPIRGVDDALAQDELKHLRKGKSKRLQHA